MIAKVEVEATKNTKDDTLEIEAYRRKQWVQNKFNCQKVFGCCEMGEPGLRFTGPLKRGLSFLMERADLCRLKFWEVLQNGFFFRRPYESFESVYFFEQLKGNHYGNV